jgi:hypothetical protein
MFPICVHDEICLDKGIDNATSTIVSGYLVSLAMLAFGFHLLYEKSRYVYADTLNGVRHESSIFSSGIFAQFFMAFGVGLQALARTLQPDQSLGNTIFWSCWVSSFVSMTLASFHHGRFAVQALKNKKRVNLFCVYCCFPSLGFAKMMLFVSSVVIFGAGIRCGRKVEYVPLNVDNIFYKSYEIQEESLNSTTFIDQGDDGDFFEREHVCQEIAFYGAYAFYMASFLFWFEASKKVRRAIRREEIDETLVVFGLSTMTAARLVPWISFTIGSLYPVWVWLASEFMNKELWELSQLAYEGLLYHYGLLLTAFLAHNWTLTLTFEREIRVKRETMLGDSTVWLTEEVFHDLTLGIFEKRKEDNLPSEEDEESNDSSASAASSFFVSRSKAGSRTEDHLPPSYDTDDSLSTDTSSSF